MASTNVATQEISSLGEQDAINVEGSPTGEVWVHATNGDVAWNGTARVEASLDGAEWFVVASLNPLSPGDYEAIPVLACYVRVNVTAYTSGTMEVRFGAYTPQ